ncbi:MAG: class I SAM-dependent methyltransferase [Acidimicrobiia bacterium]|nr:class I SAM-dependent methyltransferase [Acidimicrobiia bacterium]
MAALDPDVLKSVQFLVFSKLEGAVTAGMIHLGDRLGLYRALAAADTALTSAELAERTGLHERWVREWAYNQAAARILGVTAGDDNGIGERFSVTPEVAAVLADPSSEAFGMGMFHRLPQTMATLEVLPDSFRTGIGHDFDSHGPEGAASLERSFEPWNRAHLLPTVLPTLDGVVDKLAAGAAVADIGCGAGGAVLLMAAAFPASRFTGYDISQFALARACERLAESGVGNAAFHDPRSSSLPSDGSLDLVTSFDCIHDMTDPHAMVAAIRGALADDGTWLLADVKAHDTFTQNVAKNPMAPLMYGISVLSCMSSGLSEPGGAGLGTLGMPAARAEAMAREAGFTRFRRLPVDHAINAFYEIRP